MSGASRRQSGRNRTYLIFLTMRHNVTPFFLLLALFLGACDGDGTDASAPAPTIRVVAPDLTIAMVSTSVTVTLSVESDRTVTAVRAGDVDFVRNEGFESEWRGTLALTGGLNTFTVQPFIDGVPAEGSVLNVLKAQAEVVETSDVLMPYATGGHTMTALPDGQVVMLGGSFGAGGIALPDVHVHEQGGRFFAPRRPGFQEGRAGHTSILLPNNDILMLGGGTNGNVSGVNELVERVDIINADTGSREIPFVGAPIRRMYHSAWSSSGSDGVFITLFGGRGDVQYVPSPLLDIRSDVRVFELRGDTLYARSEALGPLIEPMAGHVTVPIDDAPRGQHKRFLVHGFRIGDVLTGKTMIFDADSPGEPDVQMAPSPAVDRLRAAAVHLPGVGAAVFGGRSATGDMITPEIEVYVSRADQFFSIPVAGDTTLVQRFGHQATLLPNGQIYLSGGFDAENAPLFDSEFLQITF